MPGADSAAGGIMGNLMETKNKIKYILYARKSSEAEDKQVASIDAQINELKKMASELGIEIADIITESKSAKAPGRPEFNRMLGLMSKGVAKGIVCWKLDRLARNPVDGGQISWMLQQGVLQQIQTYGRAYNPDDNVLMMQVELGMANQFVRDLSVNVKRGLKKKLEEGLPIGLVPEGYINSKDREKGKNVALVDPERFPIIRKMWDLMLTGNYNPQEVLEIANNQWGYRTIKRRVTGGKPLSRSAIYRLFNNPFYFGKREHPTGSGQLIDCEHKKLVSKEEFYKVQHILGNKRMWQAPHDKEFAFTGMIRCGECESSITAEEKHRVICTKCKHKFSYINRTACPKCETTIEQMGNVKRLDYIYYHCTKRKNKNCTQGSISLADLEKQIAEFLSGIHLKQEYVDWAIKHLQKEHATESNSRQVVQLSQQNAYNIATNRLDKLLEMRLRDEITEAEYLAKKAPLLAEKERLRELLEDTDNRQNTALKQTEAALTFAQKARAEFETASLQQKRVLLHTVCSKLTLFRGKLAITAYEPFNIMQHAVDLLPEIKVTLETQETPINKKPTRSFDEVSSLWLQAAIDVRTKIMESKEYIYIPELA